MQCPQCKNDVPVNEAQYGALFTCPRCMAVYFVNFDGQPEYGDMTAPPEDIQPEPPNFSPSQIENFEKVAPEVASEVFSPPDIDSPFSIAASEITDYGNQQEAISQMSYDVVIKGLDTKEVIQAYKEAIDDSKFSWVVDDIMTQIRNGESHLKKMNPIQAFVLANRIQFLDLEIEWKQNVEF